MTLAHSRRRYGAARKNAAGGVSETETLSHVLPANVRRQTFVAPRRFNQPTLNFTCPATAVCLPAEHCRKGGGLVRTVLARGRK
jgi:hypothetical protein